jgi:hypothetical protein
VRSFGKAWVFWVLALVLAGSGLSLAASQDSARVDLPSGLNSTAVTGWVLSDLDGDRNADLATARSGSHNANGYSQEVHIALGSLRQTSFRFISSGATVELSSRDVDGDNDRDLIVFEPLSSQPICVWINDGAGSFHEGRVADFRKLWSERPGPGWRSRFQSSSLLAASDERTQSLISSRGIAAPGPVVRTRTWQNEATRPDASRSDFHPRAPPRNS